MYLGMACQNFTACQIVRSLSDRSQSNGCFGMFDASVDLSLQMLPSSMRNRKIDHCFREVIQQATSTSFSKMSSDMRQPKRHVRISMRHPLAVSLVFISIKKTGRINLTSVKIEVQSLGLF